jgi:hypothetical protein
VSSAYKLFAHGRWFSPGTSASSTTKTGRHKIAEIFLIVALNTKYQLIKIFSSFFNILFKIFIPKQIVQNADYTYLDGLHLCKLKRVKWQFLSLMLTNFHYWFVRATSFSGGRGRSTRREPPTMGKQLVSFITCRCESRAVFFVMYKAGCEPTPYLW